jgi:hypothetical protein
MSAPKGNKYALGNKGGRPPMFGSPDEMEASIIQYFNYCQGEKTREPEYPTVTGLVLFLGFNSRQSLQDYKNKNEEFADIIKRAITVIENSYEQRLFTSNPTGAIFALKNMGWKDEQNVKHGGDGSAVQIKTTHNVNFRSYKKDD